MTLRDSTQTWKRFFKKHSAFFVILASLLLSIVGGGAAGVTGGMWIIQKQEKAPEFLFISSSKEPERIIEKTVVEKEYVPSETKEKSVIDIAKEISDSVVSITVTQTALMDGSEVEVGKASGFMVSQDGMIVTNKHVIRFDNAVYSATTNKGTKYPVTILAKDPLHDLAILKISKEGKQEQFKPVVFGDVAILEPGQTVIAVGNALGRFQNTVSVGVISGLGRTITASDGDYTETIEDVIQTDAAINQGNSGGPLLNLEGKVIGVNTATVLGAQSIGFAIPSSVATRDLEQVKTLGKIVYPLLGVRYTPVTKEIQQKEELSVDYGVLIVKGEDGEPAVASGSAAEKAGFAAGDVILEVDGKRITQDLTLGSVIKQYKPGDQIVIKFLRSGKERLVAAVLGEIEG